MKGRIFMLLLLTPLLAVAQEGTIDNSFNNNSGIAGRILKIVNQPDGKLLIGGEFIKYGSNGRRGIARLNADGSLDNTFVPISGVNDDVVDILLQLDGKIVIVGQFDSLNDEPQKHIARLNSDGSEDTLFNQTAFANSLISKVIVQNEDKLLIFGAFDSINNQPYRGVARLNSDGSIDPSFVVGSGASDEIRSAVLQNDGKIIIVGDFTSYDGVTANRIARLHPNGGIDDTFDVELGANRIITEVCVQPDGKLIIAGEFDSINNRKITCIGRLNSDGSIDEIFHSGGHKTGYVRTVSLQQDGKIIIGGIFSKYDEIEVRRIARLDQNGNFDNEFYLGQGPDAAVLSSLILPDKQILVSGNFKFYDGIKVNYIVQLNGYALPESGIKTFPNPTSSTITIETEDEIVSVQIYNSIEILVQTETTNNFSVASLPSGVYNMYVHTTSGVIFDQFVKI
jgi:uncharacterized delta-60 repeat protein